MKTENKTYIHISYTEQKNGKSEEKEEAAPAKAVKKMTDDGDEFKTHSTLNYKETQVESVQDFLNATMSDGSSITDEVKVDVINRGWVLFQQVAARNICLEDDPEYVNSADPVDISLAAFSPKEGKRAKASPEVRAKKSLRELYNEDPEKMRQLIEEFMREASA